MPGHCQSCDVEVLKSPRGVPLDLRNIRGEVELHDPVQEGKDRIGPVGRPSTQTDGTLVPEGETRADLTRSEVRLHTPGHRGEVERVDQCSLASVVQGFDWCGVGIPSI